MSRCSTPRACAYSSADATSRPTRAACETVRYVLLVEHRPQRAALEQLEHHERDVVVAPVVHRDDVRVVQRRRELGLGPEPAEERGVLGQRRVQHLDRDAAPQPGVLGDVDAAARARADGAVQQVPAREDTAREVAHRTAGHGFNGSGRVRATRVTGAVSPFPEPQSRDGRFAAVSLTRPANPVRVGDRRGHRARRRQRADLGRPGAGERPATVQRNRRDRHARTRTRVTSSSRRVRSARSCAPTSPASSRSTASSIPQDQVDRRPEPRRRCCFDPGPGKDIRGVHQGRPHRGARVVAAQRSRPPKRRRAKHQLRSYTWSFNVG